MPDEVLNRLLAVAEEQLRWQRAASIPGLRNTLDSVLGTNQLRQAFELCDGTRLGSEIATAVGVSPATVTRWTQHWRDLGLVYETESRRLRHLTSLASVGLGVELSGRVDDDPRQSR